MIGPKSAEDIQQLLEETAKRNTEEMVKHHKAIRVLVMFWTSNNDIQLFPPNMFFSHCFFSHHFSIQLVVL